MEHKDRMWRKTRTPNIGSACIGTDGNRNWDFMWNNGTSTLGTYTQIQLM